MRRASQRCKRKTRKISVMSPKVGVATCEQAAENKIIEKCPVDVEGWEALVTLARIEPMEGCG